LNKFTGYELILSYLMVLANTVDHTVHKDVLSYVLVLLSLTCPFVPGKSLLGQLRDKKLMKSGKTVLFLESFDFSLWEFEYSQLEQA